MFYRRRDTPPGHPLGGPRIEDMLAHQNAEADSENPPVSREPSPVTGEGRRLGDFSHNGSSSASAAGQGHRVGAGGLATEEENQSQGLLAETESLPRLIGPRINEELPAYSEQANDVNHTMNLDEGVDMEYGPSAPPLWEEQDWAFSNMNAQSRVAAPSEDGMFGEKGSSNDSTRVEDAGSPNHSLLMDDSDGSDNPIYSEPVTNDEFGNRSMRESAPPPEVPGISNDDEDDLPVMELKADPTEPSGELQFKPATH